MILFLDWHRQITVFFYLFGLIEELRILLLRNRKSSLFRKCAHLVRIAWSIHIHTSKGNMNKPALAGSPLSHASELRREQRSGGRACARQWACHATLGRFVFPSIQTPEHQRAALVIEMFYEEEWKLLVQWNVKLKSCNGNNNFFR